MDKLLTKQDLTMKLSIKKLCIVLLGVIVCFFLGHYTVFYTVFSIMHSTGYNDLYGITSLLSLNSEMSFSTWYSSLMLLVCALLLWIIYQDKASAKDRFRFHWFFLALIFLFLSADEACSIHEKLSSFIRNQVINYGLKYGEWTALYLVLLVIFLGSYLKFLKHLPGRFTMLFICAGATFVGGAVGMEIVGASYLTIEGTRDLTYYIITGVEDVFEMLGVLLFVRALLLYIHLFKVNLFIPLAE